MHLFLTVSSDFSELDVALVPLKEHDILEYVFRVNSVYWIISTGVWHTEIYNFALVWKSFRMEISTFIYNCHKIPIGEKNSEEWAEIPHEERGGRNLFYAQYCHGLKKKMQKRGILA